IDVVLKRKLTTQKVEPFRARLVKPVADDLRRRCAAWAKANMDALADAWPQIPTKLNDRQSDGWEPLLAIAEHAGGIWPDRARLAAGMLSTGQPDGDESITVRLLADVKAVFDARKDVDELPSEALVTALHAIEES